MLRPGIIITDTIDVDVEDRLGAGLVANGAAAGITFQKHDLCITARDNAGKLLAGLTGNSLGPWMYIARLWVDESHREMGLGAELMRAAEDEAINRGCVAVFLHTFEYEAPRFYEKLGYRIAGTLRHPQIPYERYYMQKDLK